MPNFKFACGGIAAPTGGKRFRACDRAKRDVRPSRKNWSVTMAALMSLVSFSLPSGAIAQREQELGSRISVPTPAEIPLSGMSEADRSRTAMVSYAGCLIERDRKKVERVLRYSPASEASNKGLSGLAIEDCLRYGEMKFKPTLLRGALFVSLYRKDFSEKFPPLPTQAVDYSTSASEAQNDDMAQQVALLQFADCTVKASYDLARSAIISKIASQEEKGAYTALAPALNECLPESLKLVFSKAVLSGIIAEALYRNAIASTDNTRKTN